MNNNDFINKLGLIFQTLSLEILFRDCNNSDLMSELQHQNKNYLEKIIEQNNEIINLLKGSDKVGR